MKIKMGILGFGGMGGWHERSIRNLEGIEVTAVHDTDDDRLKAAEAIGLKAYPDRSTFLSDDTIDLILIATPNHVHKDYSIEALNSGKNVICEKPVTLSVEELDEIISTAVSTGKIFTVHQNRRWDRDYCVMRKVAESGVLGKIYSIESKVYGNNGQIYGWRDKKEFGGGMVFDWGVHLLDHFTFMFPEKKIVSVYAQLFSVINKEVDDLFKVDMRFDDGLSVHVQVGTFSLLKQPRFFVYGDRGTLVIDDFTGEKGCMKVIRYRMDEMGRVIADTPAGPTRTMAPQPDECYDVLELPTVESSWSEFYVNIIEAIKGEEDLYVTTASVRRTMRLIEAVFESARTNMTINTDI